MKISTKLYLAVFMPVLLILVIGGTLIFSYVTMQGAFGNGDKVRQIRDSITELNHLVISYITYREERPKQQFLAEQEKMTGLIAGAHFRNPGQKQLLNEILLNGQSMKEAFFKLVSSVDLPGPTRSNKLLNEVEEGLVGQLLIRSHNADSLASNLKNLVDKDIRMTQTRTLAFIFVALVLTTFFLGLVLTQTGRRIISALTKLRQETEVVSSGNLDHVITVERNDEIGDLTLAFNRMTSSLKKITASKADLEQEMAERRRAEEELIQQREWLQVTLSSIGDAVIASDASGRVSFINPIAVGLTGWLSEEATRQPIQSIFQVINEQTRLPAENIIESVLIKGGIVNLANHTALITRDGREIPIEDSAAPIRDSAGNIIGVVLVFHDVTEKRRIQESLRASENRLRRFYESGLLGVFYWNMNGEITEANDKFLEMVGYDREDLAAGRIDWNGLTPPEYRHLDESSVAELKATGMNKRPFEKEYIRKDGSHLPILIAGAMVDEARFNGVAFVLDITERKRAEEALQKRTLELEHLTETLEERVRERTAELADLSSRLVSAQEDERRRVSYDLHDNAWQALVAIRFEMEHLFSGQEGMDWAALQKRSKKIMTDLLEAVGKIRSMQGDLWPYVLDDIGILATVDWYCREFEKNHPGLAIEKQDGLSENDIPPSAKIVIYRILQETLNNVAKHSQASRVVMGLREKDHRMEFTVEDNGLGFELEETMVKENPWGRLGLLNIKARTELSGGLFGVESVTGKGTMVRASWSLSENEGNKQEQL